VLLTLRALAGAWGTGSVWVIWAKEALLGWESPLHAAPVHGPQTQPQWRQPSLNPSGPGGWLRVRKLDFCRGGVFTVGWDLGGVDSLARAFERSSTRLNKESGASALEGLSAHVLAQA